MIIRKQCYCYITSTEDDRVLLFHRRHQNNLSEWGLLHVVVEFNEGDVNSFGRNLAQNITEVVMLHIELMAVIDVSPFNHYWIKVLCQNNEYPVKDDYCFETFCFEHEKIKKLRINQNLQQFIKEYPTNRSVEERFIEYRLKRFS